MHSASSTSPDLARDPAQGLAGADGATCARRAVIIIAAATIYRIVFIACFGPGPDEAFYWEWSRRLALGYVEHPPLIAYVIRLMSTLLGENAWAWRLVAVASAGAAGWLFFLTGRLLFDARVGLWAVVLHSVSPVLSLAGGTLIIPETLLILWISLALYLAAHIVVNDRVRLFYVLGLVFGLALLTKLPAVLIPLALGLFALLSPAHRRWFRMPQPYAMVLIGLAFMGPVLYWNATHEWAGMQFLTDRTEIKEQSSTPGAGLLWQSLTAQAAYHSPVIFIMVWVGTITAAWRGVIDRDARYLLLACFSVPVMVAFQLMAAQRFTLPHWPLSGFLAAYIVLPAVVFDAGRTPRRWRRIGIKLATGVGLVACLLGPVIMFYPLVTVAYAKAQRWVGSPPKIIEPMAHGVGWDDDIRIGVLAERARIASLTGAEPVVLTHFHMLAGVLAYALREDCEVLCIHAQAHQYDEWYGDEDLRDRPVLFISSDAFLTSTGHAGQPQDYYQFDDCTPGADTEVMRYGVLINTVHTWHCSGYRGPTDTPGPRI